MFFVGGHQQQAAPNWPRRKKRRRGLPEYSSRWPSRSTMTLVISFPLALVSKSFHVGVGQQRHVGILQRGRTAMTSASDLAWTRQGNPSQVSQRMQRLCGASASLSKMPVGA
jgi:hypothetical protein